AVRGRRLHTRRGHRRAVRNFAPARETQLRERSRRGAGGTHPAGGRAVHDSGTRVRHSPGHPHARGAGPDPPQRPPPGRARSSHPLGRTNMSRTIAIVRSMLDLVRRGNIRGFLALAEKAEPADLGDVLSSLDNDERVEVVKALPARLSSLALVEMPDET